MKNLPKTIPVFPLSNFIIFPHTTVPLNIFEPRYVEMINDSMKKNKIIGLVQPKNSDDKAMVDLRKFQRQIAELYKEEGNNSYIRTGSHLNLDLKSDFFILTFSKFLEIYILNKNFIID